MLRSDTEQASVGRQDGGGWLTAEYSPSEAFSAETTLTHLGGELELNDLGFLPRNNLLQWYTGMTRRYSDFTEQDNRCRRRPLPVGLGRGLVVGHGVGMEGVSVLVIVVEGASDEDEPDFVRTLLDDLLEVEAHAGAEGALEVGELDDGDERVPSRVAPTDWWQARSARACRTALAAGRSPTARRPPVTNAALTRAMPALWMSIAPTRWAAAARAARRAPAGPCPRCAPCNTPRSAAATARPTATPAGPRARAFLWRTRAEPVLKTDWTLQRHPRFAGSRPGRALRDGRSRLRARDRGDAVFLARTPWLDFLAASCPHTTLRAHGTAVGMASDEDMGNSEVGHNAIGAGRVFDQGAKLVDSAVESGRRFRGRAVEGSWRSRVQRAAAHALHRPALRRQRAQPHRPARSPCSADATAERVHKVRVHPLLDGRDVPETMRARLRGRAGERARPRSTPAPVATTASPRAAAA